MRARLIMKKLAEPGVASVSLSICEDGTSIALTRGGTKKPLWVAGLKVEVEGAWATLAVKACEGAVGRWMCDGVTVEMGIAESVGGLPGIGLTLTTSRPVLIGRVVLSVEIPELKTGRSFYVLKSGLPAMGGVGPLKAGEQGVESEASNLVAVLGSRGASPCLLFGSAGIGGDPSYFKVEEGKLLAGFDVSRSVEGTFTYGLRFGAGVCQHDLLDAFGESFKGLARKAGPTPTGWNSWDYYGGGISMEEFRGEMKAINASPVKKKLKYFTLDMGWEETWGVWEPNRRFPGTFKAIASEIKKAGFTPGIWTSPLQVGRFTHLARIRQDLFLRHSDGRLVIDERETPIGHALLLDFSKDEVCDMVSGWYRAMKKGGFELFKIDYIYAGFLNYLKSTDCKIGKVEFARRILQSCRDGVGKDAHIVNCGAPPEAAIGIADSSRVSSDIHNFWGHVLNSAKQVSIRTWMDMRLWRIDPDFAIVRSAANDASRWLNMPYNPRPLVGEDFWMAGPEATQEEMIVWLSLVRLTGGSTILSDSISRLNPGAIKLLAKLFPPLSVTGRPVDLFESPIARVWHTPDPNRPTVGFFNWKDVADKVKVPAGLNLPKKGKDFWTGKSVELGASVEVAGRSCLLVEY